MAEHTFNPRTQKGLKVGVQSEFQHPYTEKYSEKKLKKEKEKQCSKIYMEAYPSQTSSEKKNIKLEASHDCKLYYRAVGMRTIWLIYVQKQTNESVHISGKKKAYSAAVN